MVCSLFVFSSRRRHTRFDCDWSSDVCSSDLGSTVAHLAALLAALGASTGMFTSPHFIRYNERIRVNGAEVADQELIGAFERIEAARGAITLTFFEYNTLAARSEEHTSELQSQSNLVCRLLLA